MSRNIETAALTSENVLESAAVSMAIPAPAPVPEKKVENKPSFIDSHTGKIKSNFLLINRWWKRSQKEIVLRVTVIAVNKNVVINVV
ncbi:Rne, partial [Pasteurella multocida subsp. multocida str. Anand1_buffalo]